MMTNVYEHPTVSWERARDAFDRIQRKEGELLDAWIELGGQLNTLRAKHQANKDFGAACQEHGIDLTRQHRKAAMWWATLDADQRDTLRQYNPAALHPATLENRCRDQFPDWLTSTRSVVHSVDNAEHTACETENTQIQATEAPENEIELEKTDEKDEIESAARIDARMPLVCAIGKDMATKIVNQWPSKVTRQCFNATAKTAGGKKVLKRIVGMIDQYCDHPIDAQFNLYAKGVPANSFSHKLFIEGLPWSWAREYGCTWTNIKAMHSILDEMDDARLMVEDIGKDQPMNICREWWDKRKQQPTVTSGPNLEAFSTVNEDKPRIRAAEGSENNPIRAYGANIWPGENPSYTFDEAWAAYMLWHTEDKALSTANGFERPEARGRHFMSQCDYLNRLSKGFVSAFRKIAAAQRNNPNSGDDCCCPHQHIPTA